MIPILASTTTRLPLCFDCGLLRMAADTSLEFGASLLSTQQPASRKESPTLPSPSPLSSPSPSSSSSTTSRTKRASPTPIPERKPVEDWVDLENRRNGKYFGLLHENEELKVVYEASGTPLPTPSSDGGKKGKKGKIVGPRLKARRTSATSLGRAWGAESMLDMIQSLLDWVDTDMILTFPESSTTTTSRHHPKRIELSPLSEEEENNLETTK